MIIYSISAAKLARHVHSLYDLRRQNRIYLAIAYSNLAITAKPLSILNVNKEDWIRLVVLPPLYARETIFIKSLLKRDQF